MTRTVLLDGGPLGLLSHPNATPEALECERWSRSLLSQGWEVLVPEIADFELRRELLRAGKANSVAKLDSLKTVLGYLPISTPAMLQAATFWAHARQTGRPTADDKALDADVILAGQAAVLSRGRSQVLVATTNVRHLIRFVPARHWRDIG